MRSSVNNINNINSNKNARVKVAIRCRPAFQDEIEFAKGNFFSIVDCKNELESPNNYGEVALTTISGKQKKFYFDYVFGQDTNQDQVYNRLARPVINEVLKGCNGTIFAYGQTGTGKTYTMGILEFVQNEHAGVIPRAIAQIFDYIQDNNHEINISITFLQLYRETIQDLLVTANGHSSVGDENLAIREDPVRGFYVEGLQEFSVRNYREAEALINLGLENRAIAPTLMNTTSSRSHTVLTINIDQKIIGDGETVSKSLKSKLLLVDLAGSERVRRTVSKGARLSEAKSINTSLSALGNVIAALAEQNITHIPYRDSKLTRLLQDSLGGTASTALIATIGPAPINYGETLSTLLFAQRCMAVKVAPVLNEEVDYAEMCAKLQAQLTSMEAQMTEKLLVQQEEYDRKVRELHRELEEERAISQQVELNRAINGNNNDNAANSFHEELHVLLTQLYQYQLLDEDENQSIQQYWFQKPEGWIPSDLDVKTLPNGQLLAVLAYSFELIRKLTENLNHLIKLNKEREDKEREEIQHQLDIEHDNELFRENERLAMFKSDPRELTRRTQTAEDSAIKLGSHLAPLSTSEALSRVEGQFRSNNAPLSSLDRTLIQPQVLPIDVLPTIYNFNSVIEVSSSLALIHNQVDQTIEGLQILMARKDLHYKNLKRELTNQMMERRKREEEVVNWSYILKYLLANASQLKKEIKSLKSSTSQNTRFTSINTSAPLAITNSANSPQETNSVSSATAKIFDHSLSFNNSDSSSPNPPKPLLSNSQSSSNKLKSVRIQNTVDDDDEVDQLGNYFESSVTKDSFSQQQPSYNFGQQGSTKNSSKVNPLQSSSSHSQKQIAPKPTQPKKQSHPSDFAQEVVKNLGVQGQEALAAMSIIDRVSKITPEQLAQLDSDTRNQILQIRKDLGLDSPFVPSSTQRQNQAETNHIQRSRSASAPRLRSPHLNSSSQIIPKDQESEDVSDFTSNDFTQRSITPMRSAIQSKHQPTQRFPVSSQASSPGKYRRLLTNSDDRAHSPPLRSTKSSPAILSFEQPLSRNTHSQIPNKPSQTSAQYFFPSQLDDELDHDDEYSQIDQL